MAESSVSSTAEPKVESRLETSTPSAEEKRKLEEEFNMQRAKMKELFLQKEDDMRNIVMEKEQLQSEVLGLRAELQQLQTLSENQKSEIQSLQWLVNETVEASSSGSEEVRRLRSKTLDLEQQLMHHKQQDMSLAPAIVRTLARKLGADTDSEQTIKRNNNDEELLMSVLEPMEMEISALKDKLRETDSKLQEALKNKTTPSHPDSSQSAETKSEKVASRSCDMCANYEKQLVSEQRETEAAKERATVHERALKVATEELEGVRALHEETVRSWRTERSETRVQLDSLRTAVQDSRAQLDAAQQAASSAGQKALQEVTVLTVNRETLQKKLDTLERDNAMLSGRFTKKAEEMHNEVIDLPNNVEDLQGYALQLREQLLFCEIGREEALETERQLRAQLVEHADQFLTQEQNINDITHQLTEARKELDRLQTEREQMKELGDRLRHSNDIIEKLLEDKKQLQASVVELRVQTGALQQELDNSEKVQQDFVRLSQSLQVQLERIREGSTEVRWQHEEDVDQCSHCNAQLPNKKKVNCRHCGRIFCVSCVSAVPAGPRRRPARVCRVCRTLLDPACKPYFCTEPPPET